VSPITPPDPNAALNEVLSEVIDVVQDVKQASWRVPATHPLHDQLDRLFGDLRGWARLLMEQDEVLGVSPLASMPSVAGRKPAILWTGTPTDDDVRRIVGEHLDRLGEHVTAALAVQGESSSQAALAQVESDLLTHRRALSPRQDPQD
jgi:hypothetical protein